MVPDIVLDVILPSASSAECGQVLFDHLVGRLGEGVRSHQHTRPGDERHVSS
jgi:hypothetical protein